MRVAVEQIAGYNILADSQLVERGVMPYIRRGFAGEAVSRTDYSTAHGAYDSGIAAVHKLFGTDNSAL